MGRIEQEVEERVKAFTASVQDLSVEALRTINDLLDDFRGRVRSEIMGRPDVIQAARGVRLVRWLAACATLSAILLAGALLPHTHAPEWAKYSAYGLTAALLVFPFLVSRKPSESDLSRLAENELKALQCFSVPTFVNPHTGQLTISGINTQGSLWNKERQTSFNQTANSISKSVYYLGDKAAGLEVAAVFAVVNYTIAWFSKPKAKDVFRAWALPRNASPLLTRIDPPRSCSPEVTHPFSAREN